MSAAQKKIFLDLLHTMILVLSVILIVYISVDSINDRNFLENHDYMVFQFWVCVAFIFDFFVELWLSQRKWEFIRHRWYFLLLSIPYLNIIPLTGWLVTEEELYFLRFIPLARGALALSIVIGYISKNNFLGLLVTYSSILILVTYFAALIFYQKENSVNSGVTDYWDAFWWGCSQATTLGCDIYPVTAVGRILCCILSAMGIVMFPLFTVYATDAIQRYYSRKVDTTVNSHIVKP